jgi:hypothetical protein
VEPKRKSPTDAIVDMLSEELRKLILGLPEDIQESVPEKLKEETGLARDEDRTKKANDQKDR